MEAPELEKRIGYRFRQVSLLETALTHSSFANESGGSAVCNERLEFLGDSVLGMIVAEELYRRFPRMPEGRMTRLRAELVCEQSLYRVAQSLELGASMRLGRGMEHNGGRDRPSILADAVEALIAAIYLDAGHAEASRFVHERLLNQLGEEEPLYFNDCKTALQELVQEQKNQILSYELLDESGPDHNKVFHVRVLLNGAEIGQGHGRSKKEAEQAAAGMALKKLSK
ncbi:MAG: ribonuclease III [Oscillospiraceae bacterium]|nr:ribonuclease III [Oscillospiraceae bacterium]